MPQSPKDESHENDTSSSRKKYRKHAKFIPNLTQLQDAAKTLPDAEMWTEDHFQHSLIVNKEQRNSNYSGHFIF